MCSRSQNSLFENEGLGTISIISKENTINSPSLIHDVWQFEHDPDNRFLVDAFSRESETVKKHSYQEMAKEGPRERKFFNKKGTKNFEYFSQVTIEMEKRNQYGLMGSEKIINDRKTVNKNRKRMALKTEKQSKSDEKRTRNNLRKDFHTLQIKENPVSSHERDSHLFENEALQRDLDILHRKSISNINYLLCLTKELLTLNKSMLIEIEKEEVKKSLMKLEIDCRKLRIGLRTSNCSKKLHSIGKKEEKSAKKIYLKPVKSNYLRREDQLLENIVREKRKINELKTKQSSLNNYYTVVKNKSSINQTPSFINFKFTRKKKFTFHLTQEQKINYYNILVAKRNMLQSWVDETEHHVKRKCDELGWEKKLIKDETEMIDNKIKSLGQINARQAGYLSPSRHVLNKKSTLKSFHRSKSKRSLNLRSNSQDKELSYLANESKNFSIEKGQNQRQFFWGRSKKEKTQTQNYEDEYFVNIKPCQ